MNIISRVLLGVLGVLGVLVSGCSTPAPIFPRQDPPLLWPRTGDTPRFAYVGKLEGEADLKRPKSVWSWLGDMLAGAHPPAALRSPYGLAVTSSGALYVADPDARVVHCFDLEGRGYQAFTDAGDGCRFHTPIGIAVATDRVLVADRALRTITVLSFDGEPQLVFGESELEGPVGVAVGPHSGRIYVADVAGHRVQVFEPHGEFAFTLGKRGAGAGEFNFPTFVACGPDEKVYVSDSLNFRIQVFDRAGRFVREWGTKGDYPGSFSQPKGIAIDRLGHVYVVDAHFENVQVFDESGQLLLAFGEEGTDRGQFWLPVGISCDAQDRIWVGDSFNHRVQVFRYLAENHTGGAQ